MQVEGDELARLKRDVIKRGSRYSSSDLDGAIADFDHALETLGVNVKRAKKTGETQCLVVLAAEAAPGVSDLERRLAEAWLRDGAFAHEAHTISSDGGLVVLDFATWWDGGAYCTGRFEVAVRERSVAVTARLNSA